MQSSVQRKVEGSNPSGPAMLGPLLTIVTEEVATLAEVPTVPTASGLPFGEIRGRWARF